MKDERAKMNRRQTESRGCLHTLPRCEGGKACEAGLKIKEQRKKSLCSLLSALLSLLSLLLPSAAALAATFHLADDAHDDKETYGDEDYNHHPVIQVVALHT